MTKSYHNSLYGNRLRRAIAGFLFCATVSSLSATPAYCQDGGQLIETSSGDAFMEEVVDPNDQQRRQEELTRRPKLDRHPLSPEELQNLGVQVNSHGNLIPLINRGAPPVQEQMSTVTSYEEPWWNFAPVVWGPTPGYPGGPFNYPYAQIGGSQYPYLPSWRQTPFFTPPYPVPAFGSPFQSPWLAPQPWLTPQFSLGFNSGMPTISGPVNSTTSTLPDGSTQINTSGSLLQSPFWNGFLGTGPTGNIVGGGSFTLPTETDFQSTTTFTPLVPNLP
ncbi:MAG: hypothetical protein K2Z81_23975 [Cyanobacteria bacterium]|nr:hypothetical protein [Cyanobacteriota bacterium]